MIIKNTTVLSAEEASKEVIDITRKYYYKKYIFSGILSVLGIVILIVAILMENANDSQIIGILFLAFGLILTGINTISILRIKKKLMKQNPALVEEGIIYTYTFKEESFQLQSKIGSSVSKFELPYTELKRIVEYDDRIDFVVSSTEIYTCKKSSFQNKKEEELFFFGLAKHKTKVKKKTSKDTQK